MRLYRKQVCKILDEPRNWLELGEVVKKKPTEVKTNFLDRWRIKIVSFVLETKVFKIVYQQPPSVSFVIKIY